MWTLITTTVVSVIHSILRSEELGESKLPTNEENEGGDNGGVDGGQLKDMVFFKRDLEVDLIYFVE